MKWDVVEPAEPVASGLYLQRLVNLPLAPTSELI